MPLKYRDHELKGEYMGFRECHIKSDWNLFCKRDGTYIILDMNGNICEFI